MGGSGGSPARASSLPAALLLLSLCCLLSGCGRCEKVGDAGARPQPAPLATNYLRVVWQQAPSEPLVTSTVFMPGFRRAQSDEELQDFYKTNLEPDLAHWRELRERRGRRSMLSELVSQAQAMSLTSTYIGVVIVRDGRVHTFHSAGTYKFAVLRLQRLGSKIMELFASGVHVPNTFMIVNAEDVPICFRMGGCQVPVFAFFKQWHPPPPPGAAGQRKHPPRQDTEILLPSPSQDWDNLYFFPWEEKNNTAFHRAIFQGTMPKTCTRYRLAELSVRDNATAQLLDVGLSLRTYRVPQRLRKPFVSLANHSRWRFLITTDGHTASSRLGHLLGMNSVVLKERSPWIEYYYRGLTQGKDHVEFTLDNVLQLIQDLRGKDLVEQALGNVLQTIKDLRQPERDAEMRQMSASAQRFAYAYLHKRAKALYIRQAILRYNELIKGTELMDGMAFLEELRPQQLSNLTVAQLVLAIGRAGRHTQKNSSHFPL